jgi:hypothetical protein
MVLSLLAETQVFNELALLPIRRAVMAPRWFDRLRNGSGFSFEVRDSNCGRDQILMFESSEPVARCKSVAARHVTGWRWAGGVEICLPV